MEILAITINTIAMVALGAYALHRVGNGETERFREFTKSVLAKDLNQYVESIPDEADVPLEVENELVDVREIGEKELIKHLNKEYENI